MAAEKKSLDALTKLKEIPDMTCDGAKLEELNLKRTLPMKEERQLLWVIQDGDDPLSRQALPSWVARHVGRKVCWWSACYSKWQNKSLSGWPRESQDCPRHSRNSMKSGPPTTRWRTCCSTRPRNAWSRRCSQMFARRT